jgi:rfaE bifunctional protein kinase chain/domain
LRRSEERPGGAANVARNVASLGAKASLLSVVGADEAGHALERLVAADGIVASLHHDPSLPTTVKLRVIARQQQLLRIDFETRPSQEVLAAKLKDFGDRVGDADVVVLSDYGKGGLAHIGAMIGQARAAGRKVLVDPKGEDWAKYRGATLVTPNTAEMREVAGRWTERCGPRRARRQAAPRARPRSAARDPLGGGDEPVHRRGRGSHPRPWRARCSTSRAPATP